MKRHDPYGPMLEELCTRNDNDSEELFRESLRQTQPYVRALRAAYGHCPSTADYSQASMRAAYLLAYYPYYIEPLYYVLSRIPKEIIKAAFGFSKLRACFLGCGPAPEVLGWISFLNDNCPAVDSATAYLFDCVVDGWRTGQEITQYHLKEQYWPGKKLTFVPLQYDMLGNQLIESPWADRAIKISHLYVMQNCMNEYIGHESDFRKKFLELFRTTQAGAIFILIDLNFEPIRELMRQIEKDIVDNKLGEVPLPVREEFDEIQCNFELPPILSEELFTGQDGLMAKKYTRYYSSILFRVEKPLDG